MYVALHVVYITKPYRGVTLCSTHFPFPNGVFVARKKKGEVDLYFVLRTRRVGATVDVVCVNFDHRTCANMQWCREISPRCLFHGMQCEPPSRTFVNFIANIGT